MKIFSLVCGIALTIKFFLDIILFAKDKDGWSAAHKKGHYDFIDAIAIDLIVILFCLKDIIS